MSKGMWVVGTGGRLVVSASSTELPNMFPGGGYRITSSRYEIVIIKSILNFNPRPTQTNHMVRVAQYLVFCLVLCNFCLLTFGHCIVCHSSSIYGFWLRLWYLHIVLLGNNTESLIVDHRWCHLCRVLYFFLVEYHSCTFRKIVIALQPLQS